jgi:hypothetical protein
MSRKTDKPEISFQDVCKAALQLVWDNSYGKCHMASGLNGVHRIEDGEQVYYLRVEARKGPDATRKTPVEYLVVRVRLTGPAHKTLRASFVTTPPDALRSWLSS